MDGESDILMYAGVGPPNALTVSVCTNVSLDAFLTAHPPLTVVVVKAHRGHQLSLSAPFEFPAPHVMTTGDHPRANPFSHPGFDDEVADLGFTRTKSPVWTSIRAASIGCIHSGLVCAISSSHLALALRV